MANKVINKNAGKGKTKTQKAKDVSRSVIQEGELKNVAVTDIDFTPFNYRKYFSEKALEDFATEIALHGIISPLTLRAMSSGRYELVAGERRLRAARIAKLKEVPAVIKVLTDDEVIELQLSENLQRENPHPMHEAQAIGQMQKTGKNINEIAARLGKSKQFVYSRLKLLTLIESLQEMFLADKFTILEAFEIASISQDSQAEFFNAYCTGWRDQKDFDLDNLSYALSQFKYDLKEAPFNTKDKELIPEAGACTGCPSNTASLKTLFPEFAKHAVCTSKSCYHRKCDAYFTLTCLNAIQEHEPDALLYSRKDVLEELLRLIPGAGSLPKYNRYEVTILSAPELPDKDDYCDESEAEEGEEPGSDSDGFTQAMEEYNSELESYNQMVESGKALKGLFISHNKIESFLFSPAAPGNHSFKNVVTAKQVQEAIKQGKATPELLKSEIERIKAREERAKEIDRDKVQDKVHTLFNSQLTEGQEKFILTEADSVGARLLVFQSLGYTARREVSAVLFKDREDSIGNEPGNLYDALCKLTDQEYCYLIRNAIATNPEAKLPNTDTGYSLYRMAESAGLEISAIERDQERKMKDRETKKNARITELEKRISTLNPAE
ncbi:MAG: ParB/RepB/Spo0J family partition protein [Puia sp.]